MSTFVALAIITIVGTLAVWSYGLLNNWDHDRFGTDEEWAELEAALGTKEESE